MAAGSCRYHAAAGIGAAAGWTDPTCRATKIHTFISKLASLRYSVQPCTVYVPNAFSAKVRTFRLGSLIEGSITGTLGFFGKNTPRMRILADSAETCFNSAFPIAAPSERVGDEGRGWVMLRGMYAV